jgi:hypothetical protein
MLFNQTLANFSRRQRPGTSFALRNERQAKLFSFRREFYHIVKCCLDPPFEIIIRLESGRINVYKSVHRFTGEIHLPGMWPHQSLSILFRTDTQHQSITNNAGTHISVHHKCKPAEHLFFRDLRNILHFFTDPLRQTLIISHDCFLFFCPWNLFYLRCISEDLIIAICPA